MVDTTEELEAAALEGIIDMPDDLIALRNEKLALGEEIDRLTSRKKEITDAFGERLKSEGMQGFILYGKVHARRSEVSTSRVDSKKLKDEMPHLHAKYLKVTKSVRVVVN